MNQNSNFSSFEKAFLRPGRLIIRNDKIRWQIKIVTMAGLKPYYISVFYLILLSLFFAGCIKSKNGGSTPIIITPPPVTPTGINYYLTTGDRSSLLSKQTTQLPFDVIANALPDINVDATQKYQTIDGFGYTLTQGSAGLINQLPPADRSALITELFGNLDNGLNVSFLRIGIGATDLSSTVYSYDDMPSGQTDLTLSNFSLTPDQSAVIPVLKQNLQVNPNKKLLATPWSAPVWMKDNNSTIG